MRIAPWWHGFGPESEIVDEAGEALHNPVQHVVIKINQRANEHARKRMEQEIASLKALNNRQVVTVLDSGIESGYSWYAMDYVGPCNLGDILLVRRQGVPSDLLALFKVSLTALLAWCRKTSASAYRFRPR